MEGLMLDCEIDIRRAVAGHQLRVIPEHGKLQILTAPTSSDGAQERNLNKLYLHPPRTLNRPSLHMR